MAWLGAKIQQLDSPVAAQGRTNNMSEQYVFCTSKDSLNFHPDNNSHSFIVELPYLLTLSGDWECGLVDVKFETLTPIQIPVINICSDLCVNSCLGSERVPILRRLLHPNQPLVNPYYIRLASDQIQRFRIYLMYDTRTVESLPLTKLYCTLHFRKCLGNRSFRM